MAAHHTGSVIEKLEDESDIKENTEYNDNGNPVNTDNLALCGILDCDEWQGHSMKKDKLFYWQRGYNAFESGKWIVAFGQCNSWQRKAYKAGYETARLYSYATHDNPTDYQLDKLKSIIKG